MKVDLFDFELPPERIALRPASPRDSARILLVDGPAPFEDRIVRELPQLLRRGDVLVFNDTRVIPAQLEGRRGEARIGATLHKRIDLRRWQAFIRNAKRLKPGDRIEFAAGVSAIAEARHADGSFTLAFEGNEPVELLLERAGQMPLPPYIAGKRPTDEQDKSDYQTIFAEKDGAVAAPTASLHFDAPLLAALQARGVAFSHVTLHVGAGTFLPVKVDDPTRHKMHAEWGEVSAVAADEIAQTRRECGRIIPVGTTALRLIETAARDTGEVRPWAAPTDIFIYPGFRFQAADALMTNFHLPKSTLMMLVSALMGTARMQAVYAHAIARGYRFFSYGDASLLLPERENSRRADHGL